MSLTESDKQHLAVPLDARTKVEWVSRDGEEEVFVARLIVERDQQPTLHAYKAIYKSVLGRDPPRMHAQMLVVSLLNAAMPFPPGWKEWGEQNSTELVRLIDLCEKCFPPQAEVPNAPV